MYQDLELHNKTFRSTVMTGGRCPFEKFLIEKAVKFSWVTIHHNCALITNSWCLWSPQCCIFPIWTDMNHQKAAPLSYSTTIHLEEVAVQDGAFFLTFLPTLFGQSICPSSSRQPVLSLQPLSIRARAGHLSSSLSVDRDGQTGPWEESIRTFLPTCLLPAHLSCHLTKGGFEAMGLAQSARSTFWSTAKTV